MFILEAVPTVLLGFSVLFLLPDGPKDAKFLTPAERETISRMVSREQAVASHSSLREGLTQPEVWRLAFIYLALVTGLYGFGFWAPQMIKALGDFSNFQVGLIAILPFGIGAVTMRIWAVRSDRKNERKFHLALPAFAGGAAFVAGAFAPSPTVTILVFILAAMGIYPTLPVFWTLPTRLLSGTAAAGGIALINSVGNLGGYVGPFFMGWLLELTGDYRAGLVALGSALILAGLLVFVRFEKPAGTAPV
jgi:ACS family tartrate transporter-like MFS transporter